MVRIGAKGRKELLVCEAVVQILFYLVLANITAAISISQAIPRCTMNPPQIERVW